MNDFTIVDQNIFTEFTENKLSLGFNPDDNCIEDKLNNPRSVLKEILASLAKIKISMEMNKSDELMKLYSDQLIPILSISCRGKYYKDIRGHLLWSPREAY